jgi:heme-degrading monooxygenase HmoA
MIWTSGTWTVRAGAEERFVPAWQEMARWSLAAFPGSGPAWLLQDRNRPTVFVSLGAWPSEATVAAWRAADGFRQRVAAMEELLETFEARTLDQVVSLVPGATPAG